MSTNNKKAVKMLKFGDFCEVVSDYLSNDGLPSSTIVFIAGTQPVQDDEDDVYNLRIKMIVNKVEDFHVDTTKFFLVDPSSLNKVNKKEQNKLSQILEEDFSTKENETVN